MFRCLASKITGQLRNRLLWPQCENSRGSLLCNQATRLFAFGSQQQPRKLPTIATNTGILRCANSVLAAGQGATVLPRHQWARHFYAKGSKVRYLDFRYKFRSDYYKTHLLIIRRQKMKKHRRRKWRKKFKCLLAKKRLKREIVKEKTFRVELLTMIRRAEQFDPREYALRKIKEASSVKREATREERLEALKQLIRENRYQVTYIKPKHRRAETLEDL